MPNKPGSSKGSKPPDKISLASDAHCPHSDVPAGAGRVVLGGRPGSSVGLPGACPTAPHTGSYYSKRQAKWAGKSSPDRLNRLASHSDCKSWTQVGSRSLGPTPARLLSACPGGSDVDCCSWHRAQSLPRLCGPWRFGGETTAARAPESSGGWLGVPKLGPDSGSP